MEDKIFYLSSCNTCVRIMKEWGHSDSFINQNIKEQHISEAELDYAKEHVGSYEALFNKRAQKYRSEGYNAKTHTESEWKTLILGEYTFLKRPLVFLGGKVYAGNAKKTVNEVKEVLNG